MTRPLLHFSKSPSWVRLAISCRSHSANSSCIAEPVACIVQGDQFHPELPEVLVPQEPVETGAEQPVSFLGEHDFHGPGLRQPHHAPQARPMRVSTAAPVAPDPLPDPV